MRKRTEDEKTSMAPMEVIFGTNKYQIKPLPILKAREWRKHLVEFIGEIIPGVTSAEEVPLVSFTGQFQATLTKALLDAPEKLAEQIFAYAPDLPREEILEAATDEQVQEAFSGVFILAFPHLAELGRLTQIARTALGSAQPASYLN